MTYNLDSSCGTHLSPRIFFQIIGRWPMMAPQVWGKARMPKGAGSYFLRFRPLCCAGFQCRLCRYCTMAPSQGHVKPGRGTITMQPLPLIRSRVIKTERVSWVACAATFNERPRIHPHSQQDAHARNNRLPTRSCFLTFALS